MIILYIALLACLLFFLPRIWYSRCWYKEIMARAYFGSDALFEGESEFLYEEVENAKLLPLPVVKVGLRTDKNLIFPDASNSSLTDHYYRNEIFSLGGKQKIRRKLPFVCGKRGFYEIGNLTFVCSDLFLTRQDILELPNHSCIYVYPKRINSDSFQKVLQHLNGEVLVKNGILADPFEYRGVREYQPYDSMKAVNWKASAKTGELKVNLKAYTSLNEVRIFLDLYNIGGFHRNDMQEMSIRIAAGVAENFCKREMRVSVYSNGRDMETGKTLSMGPDMGQVFMERIYRAFARMDLKKNIGTFEESLKDLLESGAENTFTVIISSDTGKSLQNILSGLHAKNREFVWLYAAALSGEAPVCSELKPYLHYIREETGYE